MQRDDLIRIRHMLDAGQKAVSFSANKSRADLDDDPVLAFGLMKAIEIIGEAASKVSRGTQERLKEIPWQQIWVCAIGSFTPTLTLAWTFCGIR